MPCSRGTSSNQLGRVPRQPDYDDIGQRHADRLVLACAAYGELADHVARRWRIQIATLTFGIPRTLTARFWRQGRRMARRSNARLVHGHREREASSVRCPCKVLREIGKDTRPTGRALATKCIADHPRMTMLSLPNTGGDALAVPAPAVHRVIELSGACMHPTALEGRDGGYHNHFSADR